MSIEVALYRGLASFVYRSEFCRTRVQEGSETTGEAGGEIILLGHSRVNRRVGGRGERIIELCVGSVAC
jgi:hypothetical protein